MFENQHTTIVSEGHPLDIAQSLRVQADVDGSAGGAKVRVKHLNTINTQLESHSDQRRLTETGQGVSLWVTKCSCKFLGDVP